MPRIRSNSPEYPEGESIDSLLRKLQFPTAREVWERSIQSLFPLWKQNNDLFSRIIERFHIPQFLLYGAPGAEMKQLMEKRKGECTALTVRYAEDDFYYLTNLYELAFMVHQKAFEVPLAEEDPGGIAALYNASIPSRKNFHFRRKMETGSPWSKTTYIGTQKKQWKEEEKFYPQLASEGTLYAGRSEVVKEFVVIRPKNFNQFVRGKLISHEEIQLGKFEEIYKMTRSTNHGEIILRSEVERRFVSQKILREVFDRLHLIKK